MKRNGVQPFRTMEQVGQLVLPFVKPFHFFTQLSRHITEAINAQVKFTRYNFTANLNLRLTKTTKIDFGASGWISNGNFPGASAGSIWDAAYKLPPVVLPVKYSNGLFSKLRTGDINNPYTLLTQSGYVTEFRSQLWSNIRLTQDLDFWVKGLSITGMFSFDNYNTHTISRTKSVDGYLASGRDANGELILEQTQVGTNFLGYSRSNGGTRQCTPKRPSTTVAPLAIMRLPACCCTTSLTGRTHLPVILFRLYHSVIWDWPAGLPMPTTTNTWQKPILATTVPKPLRPVSDLVSSPHLV